jgi:hypothetical protein
MEAAQAAEQTLVDDWRVRAREREAAEKASRVRVAMGPIIGAVVVGNLLTAVVIAGVYFLFFGH